jgi:methylmalonyl-CoA mutase C-terminal domain/subunit
MEKKIIRVLMSKPGADGHWRGAVTVSGALRDAGMEVIFGGFQSIEEIVDTAIDEDVDVIGVSIHSMAHMAYASQLMELLEKKGAKKDFLIMFGGAIPDEDVPKLKSMGVSEVFGPGTPTKEIVKHIKKAIEVKN